MSIPKFTIGMLLTIMLCSLGITTEAKLLSTDIQSYSDSLTQQKVKRWIQTRIATARLQNKMKANAAAYEDVVQAFFAKRRELLKTKGWSETDFEATEERIFNAVSAIDMATEMEQERADHREQVAEIKANQFYSDQQKQQMIQMLQKMRDEKKNRLINPTKPDWPAVRPYLSTLEKLTDWVAGNVPDPPQVP